MTLKHFVAFSAAAVLAVSAWAQDEESDSEAAEGVADEAAKVAEAKKAKDAPKASFTTLPLCRHCEGIVEVRVGEGEWQPAEEGRFYPLGSTYRTQKGGKFTLAFGRDSFVSIEGDAMFGTRPEKLGVKSRTVMLMSGRINIDMPDNLPEDAFFVTAPGFTVCDLAGESRYDYQDKGDGDVVTVRCVTGSLSVKGRHYSIPVMRAANEVEIRTSHDHLFTSLYGNSGDYMVKLERGERIKEEVGDDGKMKSSIEKCDSEWKLSPATKVVIRRAVPALGERMSVFMMCFDTAGNVKSQCSYCEGRAEINSGEMIKKEKASGEDIAKRAAEASETTEGAAETTDEPAEGSGQAESSEDSDDGEL